MGAWQLADGLIISSLHVVCEQGCNFAVIAKKIKKILHKAGIHSTAIQPEFIPLEPNAVRCSSGSLCLVICTHNFLSSLLAIVVKKIAWKTVTKIGAARPLRSPPRAYLPA